MLALNGLLAFAVELAALFAWGYWAWTVPGPAPLRALGALLAVGAFAALWGRFAAPKARRRLGGAALVVFKAAMFATGGLALAASGFGPYGLLLAVAGAAQIGFALALGAL